MKQFLVILFMLSSIPSYASSASSSNYDRKYFNDDESVGVYLPQYYSPVYGQLFIADTQKGVAGVCKHFGLPGRVLYTKTIPFNTDDNPQYLDVIYNRWMTQMVTFNDYNDDIKEITKKKLFTEAIAYLVCGDINRDFYKRKISRNYKAIIKRGKLSTIIEPKFKFLGNEYGLTINPVWQKGPTSDIWLTGRNGQGLSLCRFYGYEQYISAEEYEKYIPKSINKFFSVSIDNHGWLLDIHRFYNKVYRPLKSITCR